MKRFLVALFILAVVLLALQVFLRPRPASLLVPTADDLSARIANRDNFHLYAVDFVL